MDLVCVWGANLQDQTDSDLTRHRSNKQIIEEKSIKLANKFTYFT